MPQLSTVTATTPAVSSVPRMTPVTASQNKRVVINALGSCKVHWTQLEWWRSQCLVGALVGVESVELTSENILVILNMIFKVEKILKGSLDLIPSPSLSVKIQIIGRKVCLRCKGKTLLGVVNKLLKTKSLLTLPSNVLPYHLK